MSDDCGEPIVDDDFSAGQIDAQRWNEYKEAGIIEASGGFARLRSEQPEAYAELISVRQHPAEGTRLYAELESEIEGAGYFGVSLTSGDMRFELYADAETGTFTPRSGVPPDFTFLCDDCSLPFTSDARYAVRLRVTDGQVSFELSTAGGPWQPLTSAAIIEGDFRAAVWVYQDTGENSVLLRVDRLRWSSCQDASSSLVR